VRAVPRAALAQVAAAAGAGPLHVHLSEQPAENADCVSAYGRTPTELLAEAGFLRPLTTVVHATHLTPGDIALLGGAGVHVSFCPTTERDLADGIGPAAELVEAGATLTLGSDSHAVIDPFEEMRAIEMHARLATGRRGRWRAADLVRAATTDGHTSLGFADVGEIAVGQRADLVVLDLGSTRTAGTGADENTVVFAATAADVVLTMVDGTVVFRAADREGIGAELSAAIAAVVGDDRLTS
jgi:cytosine/adenosine deaminase-related metal-dependent hydrolase